MTTETQDATELTQISLSIDDQHDPAVPYIKNKKKLRKVKDWAVNDLPSNNYETAKFWILMLSGVVVVRFVLFITFLLLGGLCGVVAAIGAPKDPNTPWPKWRTWIASPISFFARCLLFSAGFHYIDVLDKQKTKGQMVVIAPHTGLMDSFFITWYFLPSPISKAAVRNIPVFGSLCIALQTIFVERDSAREGPYSRKNVIETMLVRAKDTRFPRMCIFPEGTTNNGGCIMQFKKGAFAPGQPITPVLLTYPNEHYNCACSGRNGTDMSLVRCLFQFHNRMKATILDAYEPNEEEKADPILFAKNVRNYMAKEMSLPTTEHSYPDMFLSMEGAAYKEPYFFDATFEMCEAKRIYGVDLDDCKLLLKRFAEIDKEKRGSISVESFKTLFHLQTAEENFVKRFYAFFDIDDTGAIEFSEFLEAVALVSSISTTEEKTALAFVFSDKFGMGTVSVQNINSVADEAKKMGLIEDTASFLVSENKGSIELAEYEEMVKNNPKIIEPAIEIIKAQFGASFENIKAKVEKERDAKMTTGDI